MPRKSRAKPPNPFLRFNPSPEVTRLVVMIYVRFPLSLRNFEDLLFERGIDNVHRPCSSRLGEQEPQRNQVLNHWTATSNGPAGSPSVSYKLQTGASPQQ